MLILWSFWQVHPRVTRRLQTKDSHSTTMYRTLVSCCFTPRLFAGDSAKDTEAGVQLRMVCESVGLTPNDSIWQQTWKNTNACNFFSIWKAQLPEWAAATVIQKQHILCLHYIYMHGIRSTFVKASPLDFSVVQDPGSNPVRQAGGKALSPVREEREEEDLSHVCNRSRWSSWW